MNSTQLSLVIPSFLLSLSLPSPPSFSAWCQVWGLRSVPKCLQSTELQTSLQHFFQLDCCDLIFLITFFKESFFIAFFFFFFSGRFSNRFFSAVSPHLHHHPIRLFLFLFQVSIKKSINRKREDFFFGKWGPVSRSSSNQYGPEKRWRIGVGHEQEKGEKQFTNMVDSSYVGLFLYQNIFKGLKKKKKRRRRRKN